MPLPGKWSQIDIKPLTGLMDVRSSPDAVLPGSWRYRQNVFVQDKDGCCRRPGWSKLFSTDFYNNEDLHDQLINLQYYYEDRDPPYVPQSDITIFPPGDDANGTPFCGIDQLVRKTGRQPITMLFAANSSSDVRKLLAGTQNRLYEFSEDKGNWRIIADKYGGTPINFAVSERRWSAAQLIDTVILTNGFDPVLARILDGPIEGCAMQGVTEIESLAEIALTKASVVAAWKGTIFLGDVEMDGERHGNRLVWSDFNKPLSFVPSNASTAGTQDLGANERILAAKPLGDALYIYTTHAIWECRFVGGDEVFTFRSLYSEPENGNGCLAYRFTLISTGQAHFYLGRDGIYAFNAFIPEPDRVEWMHAATLNLFSTIDESRCDSHSAWFNPSTKEYWVSWVENGYNFPRQTLVFNTRYHSDDVVDHGITAFCTFQSEVIPSVEKWAQDNLICTQAEIDEAQDLFPPELKEGGYCLLQVPKTCADTELEPLTVKPQWLTDQINCETQGTDEEPLTFMTGEILYANVSKSQSALCVDRYLPMVTSQTITVDGLEIEDFDAAPEVDSLCGVFGDQTVEDICDECDSPAVFIFASASDWCLKEYGTVFYRERCTNCAPCGTYVRDGYDTIWRTGAIDGGWPREDKNARSIEVEFDAALQVTPNLLAVRLGHSAQAVDPNLESTGRCALVWRSLKPKPMHCMSDRSGDEHKSKGTRPNRPLSWTFLYTGRYFYIEMKVSGINGDVCFSRLSIEAQQRPRSITS